jgi:N-acetylglutamate synthase-like GNAT family acetyltransferase
MDLEFIKLHFPYLIPKELVEAVKGRTYSYAQFLVYQENQHSNPNNFLYALIDQRKVIHGYLWAEQNALDESLFINTFSIAKEYWGKGEAMELAIEFVSQLQKKTKAPRVFWMSTNDKFFAKKGFKKSKISLMEYAV